MEKLSKLYNEALNETKSYIGQCDTLRRKCDTNEEYWHVMMSKRFEIPFKLFLSSVDFNPVLDEDETPTQYIKDALRSDPETATYISVWGNKECMFLQTAGFEFIFV